MTTDAEDYSRGRQALIYYHNKMLSLYGKPVYPFSFDGLVSYLTARKGSKFLLNGLGLGSVEISLTNIRDGMETLAMDGKGKIPAENNSFYQAIANDVRNNISYVDASVFVAVESTKQIAVGAEQIEKEVLSAGNFLTKNLWVVALVVIGVGGVYVWIYSKSSPRV